MAFADMLQAGWQWMPPLTFKGGRYRLMLDPDHIDEAFERELNAMAKALEHRNDPEGECLLGAAENTAIALNGVRRLSELQAVQVPAQEEPKKEQESKEEPKPKRRGMDR